MSYILDALKKSEQARERNAPVSHYSLWPVVDEEGGQRRLWLYAIGAVAGLFAANALLVSYWLRPSAPAAPHVAAPAAALAPVAATEKKQATIIAAAPVDETRAPASAAIIANEPAAKREAPVRIASSPPAETAHAAKQSASARAKADRPPAKAAAATKEARPATKIEKATPPAEPVVQPKSTEAQTAKAQPATKKSEPNEPVKLANAAPAAQAIEAQSGKPDARAQANASPGKPAEQAKDSANRDELPVALQKELPPLAVSGFIRDGDADGMVIINEKLVRAGDEVAPGVKLERIVKDNLVFSYKGYRFTR